MGILKLRRADGEVFFSTEVENLLRLTPAPFEVNVDSHTITIEPGGAAEHTMNNMFANLIQSGSFRMEIE